MARKIDEIDVTNLDAVASIAEEVQRTGEPKLLRKHGKSLAEIVPLKTSRRQAGRPLTEADPLFALIASGRSGIPGGMSGRKREALVKAHRERTAQ